MGAEGRRAAPNRERGRRHDQRRTQGSDRHAIALRLLGERSSGDHVGVFFQLGIVVDGAGPHAATVQNLQPLGGGAPCKAWPNARVDLVTVNGAIVVTGKGSQPVIVQGFAQVGQVAHGHGEPAVAGLVDPIGSRNQCVRARFLHARGLPPGVEVGHEFLQLRVQYRRQHVDLHVLAVAACRTSVQCGENADHSLVAAHDIGCPQGTRQRRIADLPHGPHRPAIALQDQVLPRPVSIRPLRSVARDGTVDEPRVDLVELLVPDADPIGGADPEVLNQGIGLADQVVHHGQALRLLQVDHHAALVAVEREEGGHLSRGGDVLEAMSPVELAGPGRLDLQDIGAQIPQAQAGERTRQHLRAVENRDAVEGARGSQLGRMIAGLLHFPLANKYY